jgi:hypothetical protein
MPQSNFSKIHFNIILPSTPWPAKWSPSLILHYQNPACIYPRPHACYMPAYLILLD